MTVYDGSILIEKSEVSPASKVDSGIFLPGATEGKMARNAAVQSTFCCGDR